MTFLIGKAKVRRFVNPIDQVHSNYKCAKVWLGDAVMCGCTFPHNQMRRGFFGWHCNNTRCRDFLSNKDARYIERVKLDADSVNRFITRRHSSSVMNAVAKAEKTGNYLQAFGHGD